MADNDVYSWSGWGGSLSAICYVCFLNAHDLLSRLFSVMRFVRMCLHANDIVFRLFSTRVLFAWVALTCTICPAGYFLEEVTAWPEVKLQLGQVSGLALDSYGNLVIFHRGDHHWGVKWVLLTGHVFRWFTLYSCCRERLRVVCICINAFNSGFKRMEFLFPLCPCIYVWKGMRHNSWHENGLAKNGMTELSFVCVVPRYNHVIWILQ